MARHTERLSTIILGEIGYTGTKREQIANELNAKFGPKNWEKAWYINGNVENKERAIELYEEAYVEFFRSHPHELDWITSTASDVYDTNISNINSGLDYSIQEGKATHLQDIAVRRALKRLGRSFEGDHPVEIRGIDSEGAHLNPGFIDFHKPELILPVKIGHHWWREGSIEGFYQQNKALLVDPDFFMVSLAAKGPKGNIFSYSKSEYYESDSIHKVLWKRKGRDIRRLAHQDPDNYSLIQDSQNKPLSKYSCL